MKFNLKEAIAMVSVKHERLVVINKRPDAEVTANVMCNMSISDVLGLWTKTVLKVNADGSVETLYDEEAANTEMLEEPFTGDEKYGEPF